MSLNKGFVFTVNFVGDRNVCFIEDDLGADSGSGDFLCDNDFGYAEFNFD